jgi:zinc/manganese transport system substrate-binding protein
MMRLSPMIPLAGLVATLLWAAPPVFARTTASAAIGIVAAENVYGDLAQRLGGQHVRVTSILSNPDQDPHLFEVSPSIARALSGADIVVANGIGYDPWMQGLLAASASPGRSVLVVAALAGRRDGDNPHLWYDPAVIPVYARTLSAELARRDPADAAFYAGRLRDTLSAIAPVAQRAAQMRVRYAGVPVTATEPVFGEMARAIGLAMRNERFQRAVMNDTEPAASDVAAMETDLRRHRVRLLITNSQASDSAAQRLAEVAARAGVPTVGVTETEPSGRDYTAWMLGELDAVAAALDTKAPAL